MGPEPVPWELLDRYQERYGVDLEAEAATRLERTINRRKARAHALRRRIEELQSQLDDAQVELTAVRREIEGSYLTASVLVEELIGRLKEEQGEGWSPTPVLGFRVWAINHNQVVGYRTRWSTPRLEAVCLNDVDGEDIPHSINRCGPPACGTYPTKDLATLRHEFGLRSVEGYMIGVVGLTGKVVEHELGYRAAASEAKAISASLGHRLVNTAQPDLIADMFRDPEHVVASHGSAGVPTIERAERYLEHWKEQSERWTWEEKSES